MTISPEPDAAAKKQLSIGCPLKGFQAAGVAGFQGIYVIADRLEMPQHSSRNVGENANGEQKPHVAKEMRN